MGNQSGHFPSRTYLQNLKHSSSLNEVILACTSSTFFCRNTSTNIATLAIKKKKKTFWKPFRLQYIRNDEVHNLYSALFLKSTPKFLSRPALYPANERFKFCQGLASSHQKVLHNYPKNNFPGDTPIQDVLTLEGAFS